MTRTGIGRLMLVPSPREGCQHFAASYIRRKKDGCHFEEWESHRNKTKLSGTDPALNETR